MPPIEFPAHPLCTACELHEACASPGLPTRLAGHPEIPTPCTNSPRALLIVGQNPGRTEDRAGATWQGWAGELLHRWLAYTYKLNLLCDIYLTNAARCATPNNAAPHHSHVRRCLPHLVHDLRLLQGRYGADNVFVLCMGAPAAWAMSRLTIRKAAIYQGCAFSPDPASDLTPLRTFFTYHPAALAPGRKPELVGAVDAHMRQLVRALDGAERDAEKLPPIKIAPPTIGQPSLVVADIETYGILDKHTQTVFHPVRAEHVDHIPPHRQIVGASLAWRDASTEHVAWYNFYDPAERNAFVSAVSNLPPTTTFAGMNIPFDILFLRYCVPALRNILRMGRLKLDDLSIINHLHSDIRPERSLKSISHLFNTANYHALQVSTLPTGSSAASAEDPGLRFYCCTDSISTLRNILNLLGELREWWPPETPGIPRDAWRSDLLWLLIHMAEAGQRYDVTALQRLRAATEMTAHAAFLVGEAAGFKFRGTGSEAPMRRLVTQAAEEAGVLNDQRLAYTSKRKLVSFNKANIHLLQGCLPHGSPLRPVLDAYAVHATNDKLLTSYIRPLLDHPDRGCLPDGSAWPSWFPVPAHVRDESADTGGTRQCRFAAHNPPAQTQPPSIRACITSRYPDGVVVSYDLSQIELRTAALLSGDEGMMAEYCTASPDLHAATARLIFPGLTPDDPDYRSKKRFLGKTLNFLTIYRGGAFKFVETARRDLGLDLTISFAEEAIRLFWAGRQGLWEWQDALIAEVLRTGYLLFPTGWRRTFSRDRESVERTYINEICNVLVQGIGSGQVPQSCQMEFLRRREAQHIVCVMPQNDHDGVLFDCPRNQFEAVDAIADDVFRHPPLWERIAESLGRYVPVDYEMKVLYPPGLSLQGRRGAT